MSVLSASLATLAGDIMTDQISPADAAAQLRLAARMVLLLEQEVESFRIVERSRSFSRHLEGEAMRSLHEMARLPERADTSPTRAGADIVPLRPKSGGRNDG